MKGIKRQLTMEQVTKSGKLIGTRSYPKGNSEMIYEAAGCLFAVKINSNGYRTGMWCMGKKARAARAYNIKVD